MLLKILNTTEITEDEFDSWLYEFFKQEEQITYYKEQAREIGMYETIKNIVMDLPGWYIVTAVYNNGIVIDEISMS